MTVRDDRLTTREELERVFYAAGVFLDAEDMWVEQAYHRNRLHRVLAHLHGAGTAAGLKVQYATDEQELQVMPGIAVDHLGRLIEVPRKACIQIPDWFAWHRERAQLAEPTEDGTELLSTRHTRLLAQAFAIDEDATVSPGEPTPGHLIAFVMLGFKVCERGRTPAFASGPFDAIDATAPHRLRDAYELELQLVDAATAADQHPSPPFTPLADQAFDAWHAQLKDEILESWDVVRDDDRATEVFLAEVRIPAQRAAPDALPEPRAGQVDIDNHVRRFTYSTAALELLLRALHDASATDPE